MQGSRFVPILAALLILSSTAVAVLSQETMQEASKVAPLSKAELSELKASMVWVEGG